MKRNTLILTLLSSFTFLSGCKVIGTIFKAGMWWGIFLVIIIIAVIIWAISKMGGNK